MTRTASPSRAAPRFRRTRTPPKSGPKRALKSVTAGLPGIAKAVSDGSSKKKRRRGGKAGRIAVVSAAAGMAYKNRDKLMSMFRRQGSRDKADAPGNRPDTPTG